MKILGVFVVGLLAVLMAGCGGTDCEYVDATLPAMVTQSFEARVMLRLERDGRLVTLERKKVEGEARVGSNYLVRARDLVEGSCAPLVVLDAKPQ